MTDHGLTEGKDKSSRKERPTSPRPGGDPPSQKVPAGPTTKIPGISALHTIITPTCIALHGDEGMGAFDEAARRLRVEYAHCLAGWKKQGKTPTFHLVLTVERPGDREEGRS